MTERKELADRIERGYRLELVLDKFAPDTSDVLSHDEKGEIVAALRAPPHIGEQRASDDDYAAIIRKQGCKILDMCDALRPFVALLDAYEERCGDEGWIIPWVQFVSEYQWPSEQDCINARIALTAYQGQPLGGLND